MHVGGATHTHTIGPTCDLSGPRANQRAHVRVIGPRCALMGSRIGPVGMFLPHDETTTFNTDVSAPESRKVTTKPTRFVHPSSWLPPPSTPSFPHQQAEKSPQNQHFLSFNPHTPRASQSDGPANTKTPALLSKRGGHARRRRDLNPRGAMHPYLLSREAHSTGLCDVSSADYFRAFLPRARTCARRDAHWRSARRRARDSNPRCHC